MKKFEEEEQQEAEGGAEEQKDHKQAYMKASLTFNLLFRVINDCIREGDGKCLINAYKVALLYFKCYNHHKYALAVLELLCTIKLFPERACQLIWGRFINTKGSAGTNIPWIFI